ncbi:MAG: PQQ-like beta-propeller repeat protein [Verrucomicrobia bacterium]|nr:PQQ-like beta-propeller repeat protein [Verrucomicrobiota bacterium]
MRGANLILVPAVLVLGTAARFVDPAPPRVAPAPDGPAPAAGRNPDTTFHAVPGALAAGAVAGDWTSFLGSNGMLVSSETKLLREFPPGGPRLVWDVSKGEGYAAPVVEGDRLVLFHRVGDAAVVDCLHAADGRRFWRHATPTAYADRYGYNGGPRCSPAIAAGRVFTLGADGELQALDLASGAVLWRRELLKEFGLRQNFFGVGATPLVEGSNLVVNVGAPGGPCVAAFDLRTGRLAWGAGTEWGPGYSTPVAATIHGRRLVLVFAGGESDPPVGGLLAVDATDGRVAFSFPWRGKRRESVNAAPPAVLGDRILLSECYGAGGVMLQVEASGGCRPVWTNESFGLHFMAPVAKGDHIYGVDGHGPGDAFLVCVEAATGREVWRTKPRWKETVATADGPREITGGTIRCSMLAVDGRALCLGELGHLLWLDLNPAGYRELSRAWLFAAQQTWTPPVVSRGLLYVCQNERDPFRGTGRRVLCYDLREPAP